MASPPLVGTRPQRPQRPRDPTHTRDSNALRASVLDAALELGVGTSRAVENLIFDSILEDDENVTTPPLTSASAATSDESWPSVPAWSSIPTDLVLPVRSPPKVAPLTSDAQVVRSPPEDSHPSIIPRPSQHRKLRKARKDGYGSDGSHLSDNQKKKRYNKDQKMGSSSTIDAEYQSDGGYLSDATKRGADKKKKPKDRKGNKIPGEPTADPSATPFYQSIKKSRTPSDEDDISDGGYLSEVTAKRKKTFFGLRSRSPVVTRKEAPSDTPPPVPSLSLMPLSNSGHSTRSPNPFNWLDSAPLRTATAQDESSDLTSSHPRKDWSPLPPSEIFRSTARSLSIETASKDRALSTTSHEIARFSPSLPLTQTREALSHVPRSHKPDTRVLSPPHPREQKPSSASPALRSYGVRFAPPTRSGSSDDTLSIQKSSLAVITTAEKLPPRPNTSPLTPSRRPKASPSFIPPSPALSALRIASPRPTQPDLRPFVSPAHPLTPSPLMLTPSISPPQRGASPALSEYSIISSSDFIVPSPRPRFFEDLPPPSPPPTCPLPELPTPGFHPQPHSTKRGHQSPFPMQGGLSVQGTPRLVEHTELTRQEALQAHLAEVEAELQAEIQATASWDAADDDVHEDDRDDDLPWLAERVGLEPPPPPRDQEEHGYAWPDDESVRLDNPQFYLYAPPSPSGGAGLVTKRPSPDVPDDERSTYTFSYSTPSADMRAGAVTASMQSDVHSYYFGEADQDGDGDERLLHAHARFVDDGPSNGTRARLIARPDALYRLGKTPPVPKIRPF